MPDGPRNGLLWAETSDIAGVIGERWRESLKSELQSKTSISQTKQQGVLAELVRENLLTRGYEREGGVHYFRFCPTAGSVAGWHWWVGGWTNIARLPNGLPWTRARPQCSCIHVNLHHFIVVTLMERKVQSNKPKDLRCGLNPTLYLISYQSHININIYMII